MSLDLSRDSHDRLKLIRKWTGAESASAATRNALNLYDYLVDAIHNRGGSLFIEFDDARPSERVILTEVRRGLRT